MIKMTKKQYAIGIDFGTTNSVICMINDDGLPIMIPILDQKDRDIFATNILLNLDDSTFSIGDEFINYNAENKILISSIKRCLGLEISNLKEFYSKDDINYLRLEKNQFDISVDLVVSMIFSEIQKSIKSFIDSFDKENSENFHVVITVPAHFNHHARSKILKAAESNNLKVIRIINEPTAAAISYGFEKKINECIAVYDLGGGTFDVSILQIENTIFHVISTGGDSNIGGDNIDRILLDYLNRKYGYQEEDIKIINILKEAKEIKEYLSTNEIWSGKWFNNDITITKVEFENLIRSFIIKTINIFSSVLLSSSINNNIKINKIILVGGVTRMPLIKNMLLEYFDNQIKIYQIDPDKSVAIGAAIHSKSFLSLNTNHFLLDVIPLSLGIETINDTKEIIIPKNTPIPILIKKEFTSSVDGQKSFKMNIIQGESEKASECRSLVCFDLELDKFLTAHEASLEVSFAIDSNGILNISVLEKNTGAIKDISLNPSYSLTEECISKLYKK